MHPAESPPSVHVLVCVNSRPPDSGMPCCADTDGQQLHARLHAMTNERGLLRTVVVSRSMCLGWCHADGVTVAIHPAGTWLQGCRETDADDIFRDHIEPLLTEDSQG